MTRAGRRRRGLPAATALLAAAHRDASLARVCNREPRIITFALSTGTHDARILPLPPSESTKGASNSCHAPSRS